VGGGPSVGGRAGRFVMGGGSSVAGGAGSSLVGGGSSAGGVEGSSMEGGFSMGGVVEGSSVAGSGVSVVGGGAVGSLGVGGGSSAAGGAASPVLLLLGELLVLLGGLGGNVSRAGSRVACGNDDSFVDGGAVGGAVLGVGWAAGAGTGPALADRLVAIWWSLSPAHGILEPAAATPSPALLGTVSPSAPISATTCLTTTSRGWPMGLSESGASQERSETITTAAATTTAPASVYPRPALPRRRRRPMRAARRTGVFTSRPSSSSLRTSRFSMGCFGMSSAPLLPAVVSGRSGLVDLLVADGRVARANLDRRAGVLEGEVVGLGAVLDDTYLILGVTRVGHSLNTRALVGVVARVGDVERLVNVPALGLLRGLLINYWGSSLVVVVVFPPVVVVPPVIVIVVFPPLVIVAVVFPPLVVVPTLASHSGEGQRGHHYRYHRCQ
jgi:hypothetical protein